MNTSSNNNGVYATASLTGAKYSSEMNVGTSGNVISSSQQGGSYQPSATYQQQSGAIYQQQSGATYQQDMGGRTGEATETGEVRKVSSVIVETHNLQEIPKDTERYVEVPTYEEQITYVPVKEVKEIVKVVPVYDVEYVDRVVEVPRVEYVDKVVEVPVYYDVVKSVKTPKVVERPVEVVREVRVPKTRVVEKEVQVPGEVIYVDKPYNVTKEVEVVHHINTEVPVIVAQTARPIITESTHATTVDVRDIQPEVMPVDIHLAKPVDSCLQPVGIIKSTHKIANISAAQYNTLLKKLNPDYRHELPYVSENGRVEFLRDEDMSYVLAPAGVTIEGYVSTNNASTNNAGTNNASQSKVTSSVVYQAPRSIQNSSVVPAAYETTKTTTTSVTTTGQATQKQQITVDQTSNVVSVNMKGGSPLVKSPNEYPTGSASSSGSSVSSSINKIAYELEHSNQQPQKRSMMCCSTRAPTSSHQQLTYPPSSVQPVSATISVDQMHVPAPKGSLHTSVAPGSYQPVMSYQGTQSFQPSCASSNGAQLTMTAQPVRRAKLC